jgi:hypothetical protein
MNNTFLAFCIFVIILFFYIHVTAQWKTSDDLEIYESDFESASQLQEVCAVKQPVVFKFQKDQTVFERFQAAKFEKYDNLDIRVKDRTDYASASHTNDNETAVDNVLLTFRSARRLFATDTNAKYFSEKNQPFLEESGLDRIAKTMDAHLKPPLSAYAKYDLLIGSPLVTTPLRHHLESHFFIAVTRGKINVKLCPPKYSKIIPTVKDYENYEFWSPLNPYSNKPDQKHKDILQKIKFLDIEVNSGDILFLPPYWWYSISFSGDPETTVATFTYDVAMNIAAQSKHWGLYYLQQSNIKTRPAKIIRALDSEKEEEVNNENKNEDKDREAELSFEDKSSLDNPRTPTLVASLIRSGVLENISTSQPAKREIVTNAGIYVTGEK